MLMIDHSVRAQMIAYCERILPYEGCGVLLGETIGTDLYLHTFEPIENGADMPERYFRFEPQQWVSVLYKAETSGLQIGGLFHSHPAAPPIPSADDETGLPFHAPSYWIVSFLDRHSPKISAYKPFHRLDGTIGLEYTPFVTKHNV